MKLKSVLLAAVASFAGPALSLSADLSLKGPPPIVPPYNWSGVYLGGYFEDDFSAFPLSFGTTSTVLANLTPGVIGPANSALGAGGILGFAVQTSSFVWGGEVQGGFTGFNSNTSGVSNVIQLQSSIPWDIAVLARFGVLVDPKQRVLLYATGGLQAAEIDHNAQVCGVGATCVSASDSNVHWGPTGGVGLEWAPEFMPGRVRVEYRYSSVGNDSLNLAVSPTIIVHSKDNAAWNGVRFGYVYAFNGQE